MALNKNITDIIQIQNSCRSVIQELYDYESRPSEIIRESYKSVKLDDAIHFDIIEYDDFNEEFSLSSDTEEYYKTRLGQNNETNIGLIDGKLLKLEAQLNFYNKRVKNSEATDKELKLIYKILVQIPSLLKYNLFAITSSSIFAFKSEPNFDIKMDKLEICRNEISQLIDASQNVDTFLKTQYYFFKAMNNLKISSIILRLKNNSIELEKSFIKLFDDIKNFINKSIKDGEYIKKLQILKELKDENKLLGETNICELAKSKKIIIKNSKIKKIHPDDKILDYIDTIRKIIDLRKIELNDTQAYESLEYDIDEKVTVERKLYNYQKLHNNFLSQEGDLISFLLSSDIDRDRILGIFIRMVKNYSASYEIDETKYISLDDRKYIEVKRCL
ncbi:MAG: hypothetical protein SPLUMA2_SPLUMAMAG2_01189 [uncultured Sulfurimonas sp.]|nr:MAG: hypothetical protein SPLUMA2_SPLUMAMAG2_01189 [uncultured Sulfurimonas sp.]